MKEYLEFKLFASLLVAVCVIFAELALLGVCKVFKKQLTKNAVIITCVIAIIVAFTLFFILY